MNHFDTMTKYDLAFFLYVFLIHDCRSDKTQHLITIQWALAFYSSNDESINQDNYLQWLNNENSWELLFLFKFDEKENDCSKYVICTFFNIINRTIPFFRLKMEKQTSSLYQKLCSFSSEGQNLQFNELDSGNSTSGRWGFNFLSQEWSITSGSNNTAA